MGETQASHNWRGNEAFSKPRPFRDEAIDDMTGTLGGESCGVRIPTELGENAAARARDAGGKEAEDESVKESVNEPTPGK